MIAKCQLITQDPTHTFIPKSFIGKIIKARIVNSSSVLEIEIIDNNSNCIGIDGTEFEILIHQSFIEVTSPNILLLYEEEGMHSVAIYIS